MRVVAALGGNALLARGERPDASLQERHVQAAVAALSPLARDDELVVTHGNGPQVGLLALESAADPALSQPYPFDVLGAQTQGTIGYWLLQALQNALPGRQIAAIISQTLVSAADPAFGVPTKFVGPVYAEDDARRLAAERGWSVRPDGTVWRRSSPRPRRSGWSRHPWSTCCWPPARWWCAPAAVGCRWSATRAARCAAWRPSSTRT